jgi:hypothetical protein
MNTMRTCFCAGSSLRDKAHKTFAYDIKKFIRLVKILSLLFFNAVKLTCDSTSVSDPHILYADPDTNLLNENLFSNVR